MLPRRRRQFVPSSWGSSSSRGWLLLMGVLVHVQGMHCRSGRLGGRGGDGGRGRIFPAHHAIMVTARGKWRGGTRWTDPEPSATNRQWGGGCNRQGRLANVLASWVVVPKVMKCTRGTGWLLVGLIGNSATARTGTTVVYRCLFKICVVNPIWLQCLDGRTRSWGRIEIARRRWEEENLPYVGPASRAEKTYISHLCAY